MTAGAGGPRWAERRRGPWVLLALVAVAVLVVGATVLSYDSRADVGLDGWVDDPGEWEQEVAPNARWVTDEVCATRFPCIEAVQADTVLFLRFDDRVDAYAAARGFAGEAWLSDYVVAHFEPGRLTADQRVAITVALDCVNTGTAPDGVEC